MTLHANTRDDADDARDETELERDDRNWTEILQELRVIQTGTQILTGLLLTLAFQQRFTDLDSFQVDVYLGLVAVAAVATVLAISPVALHRTLFRRRAKETTVRLSNVLLKLTLTAVGLTLSGTTLLVFDVVLGRTAGLLAGGIAIALVAVAWAVVPFGIRRNFPRG